MTQDEIIDMAKQAGLLDMDYEIGQWEIHEFTNFAKLVAAKEREACAKECDAIDKSHWGCEVKASWCSDAIRARGQ